MLKIDLYAFRQRAFPRVWRLLCGVLRDREKFLLCVLFLGEFYYQGKYKYIYNNQYSWQLA